MTELTYIELHAELLKAIAKAGTVSKFARDMGLNHPDIYKMRDGTKKISEKVGDALGYRKKIVVTWVKN